MARVCRECGVSLPAEAFAHVGARVCQVCLDPEPHWQTTDESLPDYPASGGLWRRLEALDVVLQTECRRRLAAIDKQRVAMQHAAALATGDRIWDGVVEGLVLSCWESVTGQRARGAATVMRSYKSPFRSLKDVLEFCLRDGSFGLGALGTESSADARGMSPRRLAIAELMLDVGSAVRDAGLSSEDLGALVATRVGVERGPMGRMRLKVWELARTLGISDGEARAVVRNAARRLIESLVERGLLEEGYDERRGHTGRVDSNS